MSNPSLPNKSTPAPTNSDLEWIKIKEEIKSFDDEEPIMNKAKRLFTQHPMIPLGIAATCTSLILGLRAMVKGDRQQSNVMMRYRVFFQALTVGAITLSAVTIMRNREKMKESEEKSS